MEGTTNVPVVAKKICNFVRVIFFMLRKGMAKRKLMVDLNMMMKRGKTARKTMHNLVFRRHHCDHHSFYPKSGQEYEFSCSNSPSFPLSLLSHRKHHHHHSDHHNYGLFSRANAPQTLEADMDMLTVSAVQKVFDMLNKEAALSPAVRDIFYSELSSPALPGFGQTPMVRQLRVTDSPFPLRDVEVDSHVDEAADDFISKFYSGLRKENELGLL